MSVRKPAPDKLRHAAPDPSLSPSQIILLLAMNHLAPRDDEDSKPSSSP